MYLWEVLGEHGRTGILQRMWPGPGQPLSTAVGRPTNVSGRGGQPCQPCGVAAIVETQLDALSAPHGCIQGRAGPPLLPRRASTTASMASG